MNDLTIIIPIHEFKDEYVPQLKDAVESVNEASELYKSNGMVHCNIICPDAEVGEKWAEAVRDIKIIDNMPLTVAYPTSPINSDFCSIVNWGVENYVKTPHFSILEFDDQYSSKWFCLAKKYYDHHQDVTLMLPVNILIDGKYPLGLCNEMALSGAFAASSEDGLGYVSNEALHNNGGFNVTGGIFNTEDFKSINKYKPSIEVAFNYELLLRITHNKLKVYVAPHFGYYHLVGRDGSMDSINREKYSEQEMHRWHEVARSESAFNKERQIKKEAVIRGSRDLK